MTNDYEDSLLAGLLLEESGAAQFPAISAMLTPSDFTLSVYRKVYWAMLALVRTGKPLTVEAVAGELGVGQYDDVALMQPGASNLLWYAEKILEHSRRQKLIKTTATLARLSAEWHGSPAEFADEATKRIRESVEVSNAA